MKNNYAKLVFFIALLCSFQMVIGQTQKQKEEITSRYDKEKLNQLQNQFKQKRVSEKQQALQKANQLGWATLRANDDGSFDELIKVSSEGLPIYYSIHNVAAARSTRADRLNTGGDLGLNLDGQNMTAHVWDGGGTRPTHQEFDGPGGNNRVTIIDGSTLNGNSFHAMHVSGTIMASGVQTNAKGMAWQADARTADWNNDLAEATSEAANGMIVSNHSYGFGFRDRFGQVQLPQHFFGGYIDDSRDWDNLLFNAPNYLMVVAAGNDGNDDTANNNPTGGAGFDKLTGHSTSKNNLVVANAQDANIDANGNLVSVSINSSSSEGPTDDFRIKPDITGNGTSVYSTFDNSDTAYNNLTGTSMASPNVAGTLLLLQQHTNNVNGSFMKAATLKGLALHTADDAGVSGPDAVFGWGLMNAKVAATAITQNGNESLIDERTLISGQTYSITVDSDGTSPLLASISWTDRPGTSNTVVNSTTPVLVNDLDIRVTKDGTSYLPYELTGALSNAKQDNNVDPYERVDINNASGTYTITVTHKGSLVGGSQNFSLIVTGLTGTPVVCNATTPTGLNIDGFGSSTATVSWNAVTGTTYDVRYRATGTSSWTTNTISDVTTSLSGLAPQTQYEVQVRSKCSDGSNSSYSASATFTTTEVQLNYCASASTNVNDEFISRVQLGSIDNTSGAQFYSDFTNISTNLTKGSSSTITVTPTWTGTIYSEGYSVWIDYNKDGDFTDTGEQVWTQTATQTTPVSGSFTVPNGATNGATRMRVSMKYNGVPTSCETFTYGEVEDYTVNIVSGVADTTAPVISLNGASTINLTVGDSFTDPGATATDNVDGNLTSSIVVTGSVDTSTEGTYTLNYNVSDAAGNAATQVSRTVNVNAAAGDTQAPTAPTGLAASNIAQTTASLSWNASTDNVGVTGYEVFSSGTSIGTVTSTGANITGLTASTTYTYTVRAFDAAGNSSGDSNSVTFTTQSAGGGPVTDVIHEGFFETGWDGWQDGGSDCYRYNGSRSYEGSHSIRIRDNSGTASAMTSPSFNLTSYDTVEVEFYFYANSMENNEDFWLRYYNGSSWSTVASWARGTNFNNATFYTATVTLDAATYNFASNSQFRFQCDASGNNDQIYIDQVTITASSGVTSNATNSLIAVSNGYSTFDVGSSNGFEGDFTVYPNPASTTANIKLGIDIEDKAIDVNLSVIDIQGRIVLSKSYNNLSSELFNENIDVSTLNRGVYMINITSSNGMKETQKLIIK